MIELKGLTKRFGPPQGGILAVNGVSLTVAKGEVLGFLGPNGAGKSTTMKMVTGFLTPTSGTAIVAGHDVVTDPLSVKEKIGYLPEGAPAYPDMTPESFLKFCAEVRGLVRSHRQTRLAHVVDRVHLGGVLRQPIETLSKGFKRRVGLAQAMLHDPEVLILDEPTDGLDPNQKHEVRTLIREMAGKKAVILSTHILEEVDAVCTRAVIIARGRVVADGTPAELQARSRYHNAVVMCVKPTAGIPGKAFADELGRVGGVGAVETDAASDGVVRMTIVPKNGKSIVSEVGQLARSKGWDVREMHVDPGRLDEVFREVTAERE